MWNEHEPIRQQITPSGLQRTGVGRVIPSIVVLAEDGGAVAGIGQEPGQLNGVPRRHVTIPEHPMIPRALTTQVRGGGVTSAKSRTGKWKLNMALDEYENITICPCPFTNTRRKAATVENGHTP